MIRIASSLLVVATAAIAVNIEIDPAAPQNAEPDLRCTSTDQGLSERLRGVLSDHAKAARNEINLVMARMAAARLDCKHGRIERGLQAYATAEGTLREIEEKATAKLAPGVETASGEAAE